MNQAELIPYFGEKYSTVEQRRLSYDYIENYIESKHVDWTKVPDTGAIAVDFAKKLSDIPIKDLAFLASHSGYIPEFYGHDSSQETLYSKLVEVLVCEWALRVGFEKSFIQKQKASKEDVTIISGGTVIVCDAKSYRLGRSQSAPNVKDTLKKADYVKWLAAYKTDHYDPIGGLVAFPSLHQWKRGGDAILYSTDYKLPIPILYYEHLAFFLTNGITAATLMEFIREYETHFPEPIKDQAMYLEKITRELFGDHIESYNRYDRIVAEVLQEKVAWTIQSVNSRLSKNKTEIEKEIALAPLDELRKKLVESEYQRQHYKIIRQVSNITKFRIT